MNAYMCRRVYVFACVCMLHTYMKSNKHSKTRQYGMKGRLNEVRASAHCRRMYVEFVRIEFVRCR